MIPTLNKAIAQLDNLPMRADDLEAWLLVRSALVPVVGPPDLRDRHGTYTQLELESD